MATIMNKWKYLWALILGLMFGTTQEIKMNENPSCENGATQPFIKITKAPERFQSRKLMN